MKRIIESLILLLLTVCLAGFVPITARGAVKADTVGALNSDVKSGSDKIDDVTSKFKPTSDPTIILGFW